MFDNSFFKNIPKESIKNVFFDDNESFKKAKEFIKKTQNYEGSWCIDKRERDKPSFEHRTSLALYSLLINPSDEDLVSIEKGIKWLIEKQKQDGRWDGGIFVGWPGKKEDIYATSISILSLKKFNNYLYSL